MNLPKCGAVANISILRANGDMEPIGDVYGFHHNTIGRAAESSDRTYPSSMSTVQFYTQSSGTGVDVWTGTFSQSGTSVSRVSGSFDMTQISTNDLIIFGSGERAWRVSGGSASAMQVYPSQTVPATTITRYRTGTSGYGSNPSGSNQQQSGAQNASLVYSNGVTTKTLSAPAVFSPASSSYTLTAVSYNPGSATVAGQQVGGFFPIPSAPTINVGDAVVVNSFVYRITWDNYQPRTFAVSPITGIVGTGRIQRLKRISVHENAATPNRIYLVADANKITLPDMLDPSGTIIAGSSLTAIETITASGSATAASASTNGNTASTTCFGSVVTGGTVKQILWGTTTEIIAVIEYDTPVTIASGTVLTLNTSLQMVPEIT